MNEYVKLCISFKERVLFLFTGLIKKEHIISKTIDSKGSIMDVDDNQVVITDSNPKPLKVDIPFFELETSETKSNLND